MLASPDPIWDANIAYEPRSNVLRSWPSAYVRPSRGAIEFHVMALEIGWALTAGRMLGAVTAAGTDAAPSEPTWRSQRTPKFVVRRSLVQVSPTYPLV